MSAMTMKSSRKWIRIVCLVVNLSILSLLFFPVSFGTTVSSSQSPETTQDILAKFLNVKHETKKDAKKSPFESIWKTFKDIVDSTTKNVLSSSIKTSPREDEDEISQSQQKIIDDLFNRRGLLMEQSLDEHFSSQFFDSWPILKEYREKLRERNQQKDDNNSNPSAKGGRTKSKSLRWREPSIHKGDTICYCFSETIDSYWSFQWCPESQVIYQGRRQRNGALHPEHNLGSTLVPKFFESEEERQAVVGSILDVNRLMTNAEAAYPNAASFLPHFGGDVCVDGGLRRRSSLIVRHKGSSEKCKNREGTGMIIESIDEVQVCQYVLHVCEDRVNEPANSNNNTSDGENQTSSLFPEFERDFPTEAALKEINETFHFIQHHVTESYVRKSRTDAQTKTRENIVTSLHSALPPLPQTRVEANLKLIKDMFMHAYDSYLYNGYPAAEVKPISCKPASFKLVQIPGLTLIDSLDTLVILGNYTEFARAVERLRYLNDNVYEVTGLYTTGDGIFSLNHNVSVFETNIRVLGGLLSAHQLAVAFLEGKVLEQDVWAEDKTVLIGVPTGKTEICGCDEDEKSETSIPSSESKTGCKDQTDRQWVYDGFLLKLAQDIGARLLPAFNTPTGIPFGTINLLNGIPEGETPIASLAGAGTLSLEMELLGRLTGNSEFGRAAKLATRALWMRRSPLGLLGKHICSHRGHWTETRSGLGSNSDSFYEYLIKHHILFPEDADFWLQLVEAYSGLHNETRIGEWYGDVDMYSGRSRGPRRVLEALMAFYPGMQVLLGEVTPAARTLNSFFLAREYLGFLPERFQFGAWQVDHGGGSHLLRPEILESAYFLHRSSKGFQHQFRTGPSNDTMPDSSGWLWSGDFSLHLIEKLTRTRCGYSSPRDVSPKTSGKLKAEQSQIDLLDEMPSYFLSETLKYLYLLFDENNILHTDEERDWVFTTEAHPIHHEQKETSVDDKLLKQKEELKLRIQRRLAKQKKPVSDLSRGLVGDKWTEASKMGDFMAQINPLESNDKMIYRERRMREMMISQVPNSFSISIERLFPQDNSWSPFDVFSERSQMLNPAYLTFRKLGNELRLTNSCANLYSSKFLWIRALNGGIADYSDSYKSRTNDDFVAAESNMIQLGSVDALALHGTGVHIDSFYDAFFGCPIGDEKKSNQDQNSDVLQNVNGIKEGELGDGASRFKMGDSHFDIFPYPGGGGFYVKRVETGERLVTTFIEGDSDPNTGPLILVYSNNGQESTISTSKDNLDQSLTPGLGSLSSRNVVLADLDGNSYSCVLQVFEPLINHETEETCSIDENGASACGMSRRWIQNKTERNLVHEFPCSPALFGPSHISHLRKVKNVEVEAKIRAPDIDDSHGCGRFSMSSTSNGNSQESATSGSVDPNNHLVSIVYRGGCTFQEKSYNQKTQNHAEGVVVINNAEGDELFVMSGGGSEELTNMGNEEYPATVLVTNDDGQKILEILKVREDISDSHLRAKILIAHDRIADDSRPSTNPMDEIKFWPRVKANSGGLQIYAKPGWGVYAVQNVVDGESGDVHRQQFSWQLYLLKHGEAVDDVP